MAAMNDEAKRSRMQAGVIGASVGVAAIGAIVFVVMNKSSDEEERVSQTASVRDVQFPNVDPGMAKPEVKLVRDEGRSIVDTKPDPYVERQKALDEAKRTAGILGSTALAQGGAFASLTGTGDISGNIYGGLLGNEAGEMNGGFGYGRSGFGPGGGGTGWGTIGTGRYGSIGHGNGTGDGYGVGGGRGGMRRSGPVVSLGQLVATGDLDKAIIRRYVKRNIAKLTYCYEKELLAKATLEGTVTTSFTIEAQGNVTGAVASGVDGNVSSCMAGVLSGIEFPKPKGGDAVKVTVAFGVRPKS
jgi:hypothetical protein